MKKSFKLVSSLCVGLLAVGAGVALSGANMASVKEANAAGATKRIYLDQINDVSFASNAYLHYWGGTSGSNWPGVHLDTSKKIEPLNEDRSPLGRDIYYFEVDSDSTTAILNNCDGNPDHAVWNRWNNIGISSKNLVQVTAWGVQNDYDIYGYNTYNIRKVTLHYAIGDTGTEYSVSDWAKYTAPDTLTGWYTDQDCTTPYAKTNLTKDIDLYEKALDKEYTVTFDGNGADSGEMSPSVANPESEFVIPSSEFVKEGYKQVGWAISPIGDVVFTDTIPANTYSDGDEVTLYAVWNEVGYKDYFFTNNKGFESVYVHYWGSSISESTWPGQECDFAYINENDENVYKTTVPEDVTGLIFNNNDQGLQTDDIIGDKLEHTAFYCSSDSSPYEVGTWDVKYNTVCYNLNGGTGTLPAEHQVYFHGKGLLVDDGNELTKDDQVFDKWVSSLQNPIITSYVGEDGNTYIDTTHEDLTADMRIELHATYKDAPMDEGYYLVGSMTEWVLDEEYLMAFNDEKNEYSIEHTFDLDDEFKIVHHSNKTEDVYYGYEVLEGGEGSAKVAGQIVNVTKNGNMKVAYAGTYTPYFKANDTSIWISAIEETHTYRLDVTHGDTTVDSYNVVVHEGTEFVTETNVPVVAGDTLAFYKDDVIQTINPKIIGNNNCYSDNGVTTVLLNMNAKIYVDFANGTCFCDGMTFGEFGLVVDNNYVRMTYNNNPVDPSFTEWYKQGYTFAEGADIKFVDTTLTNSVAKVFSVLKINEVAKNKGFEVLDGHLLCTADGGKTTDIYVKFKTDADEVYFGDVTEDVQAAIDFAKAFNDSIGGVCKADASTDKTAMKEAWAAMSADFSKLIGAAQNIIKSATTEHANDDIKAFAAKYDYVFAKYGTAWELNNFAGRTPAASAPFTYALSANNNTLITIVVICSVSSVTLLGVILLIKRRKNLVK